jgi:hypothetical protein
MIGKKINQLATELAPVSTDLTIIGDPTTGVSKKITLAQLGAIFSGAVAFYTNLAGFPATGSLDIIYCAKDTQKLYLWSGSAYVEVFPSQALLDTYQLRSEKGNANGYASLDSLGKVPISQLPSSIMEYKGTWSAATNTPTLANGTGDTGDVYICNAAGTVNFGAGPLTFAVGDYVIYSGTIWQRSSGAVGTVTSVAASITGNSLSITGSPVVTSGTLAFAFAGNATQYVRGDGQLATLPTNGGGGGASVSYYLNGSINQGTIGGVTYYEMNKTPIIGAGTDFSRSSNGYIASFLTDANDPALLNIPAGNFNFETYFEASSGGGSPTFYIELYKYDGTTFTLIASNSGSPKLINDGANIEAYFSALAVPQTTLTLTDRLAIRIYVTTAGRTITLHTENGHLCQVITTFTTGLTALNGLTSQVQYFATGTSGSDFNISSATATHTFNLPTASATNRGALSSADWTTFNNKQNALTNPITGTGTSGQVAYFNGTTSLTSSATFAFTPTSQLLVNNSVTAASAIARGTNLTPTLTAAANGDVLVGLDIAPTFTNGAFTGVTNYGLRLSNSQAFFGGSGGIAMFIGASGAIRGDATTNGNLYIDASRDLTGGLFLRASTLNIPSGTSTTSLLNITSIASFNSAVNVINSSISSFRINNTTSAATWYFESNRNAPSGSLEITNSLTNPTITAFSTRNVAINSNTDAGFRLDVNGTARVQGQVDSINATAARFKTTSGTRIINIESYAGDWNYLKTTGANFQIGTTDVTNIYFQTNNVNRLTIAFDGASTFSSSLSAASFIPTSSTIPTNGMYLSGTNTLGFATNSTLDMVINAVGSVGIGTTNLPGQHNLRVSRNISGSTIAYGILNEGITQSDVTNFSIMYTSSAQTAAAAFTLNNMVHYYAQQSALGAGSAITTQIGFWAESNLIGATNNYGFRGAIPSGTNRWNLFMDGTANNYMAGSLGIGTTGLIGYSLRVSRNITGATSSFAVRNEGVVQSDVTADAIGFRNDSFTAASAFTLTNYWHFWARQGSIGAGSSILNQYGFHVDSNMISATNIYAFSGAIPSGLGRWNLYMSGSAANHLNGSLLIGSIVNLGFKLDVNGTTRLNDSVLISLSTSINSSAQLQVDSTTKGFLPPRMTTTQKTAISTPATGLVVYDTTLNKLSVYTGSAWETVTSI